MDKQQEQMEKKSNQSKASKMSKMSKLSKISMRKRFQDGGMLDEVSKQVSQFQSIIEEL